MYSLKESKMSFEDMFLEIADRNRIKKYNFVLYRPEHLDYWEGDLPQTTIAHVMVPSGYFKGKSLRDMEAQLNSAVMEHFKGYDIEKGLFGIDFGDVEKADPRIKVTFPDYEETPSNWDVRVGCFGVNSLCVTNNKWKHMKHIDFGILSPPHKEGFGICYDKILKEFEDIRPGDGWLVHSGNSFHFHGKNIMDHTEWVKYMDMLYEQTAKPGTTLDDCWPYLQLERNHSILRVEKSELHTQKPEIIGEIIEQPGLFD